MVTPLTDLRGNCTFGMNFLVVALCLFACLQGHFAYYTESFFISHQPMLVSIGWYVFHWLCQWKQEALGQTEALG